MFASVLGAEVQMHENHVFLHGSRKIHTCLSCAQIP